MHVTDINGCQKMTFVAHTQAYAALVWSGLKVIQHVITESTDNVNFVT